MPQLTPKFFYEYGFSHRADFDGYYFMLDDFEIKSNIDGSKFFYNGTEVTLEEEVLAIYKEATGTRLVKKYY